MIAVNEGDKLLVEAGVEKKKEAGGEGEIFAGGEKLAEYAPKKEGTEPTPEEGDYLPIKRFVGNKFCEDAVPNSPCGTVCGEILCEGFLPEFVANPADGEVIPVEAKLWREDAVGENGDACEEERGGFEIF